MDVIPSVVPATLKSISPKKSSMPWISMNTRKLSSLSGSVISPEEIPATGLLIGTPASMSESVDAHTEPCDVEPLLIVISDTVLIE